MYVIAKICGVFLLKSWIQYFLHTRTLENPQVIDQRGEGVQRLKRQKRFKDLRDKFSCSHKAKIQEGIFVGPQQMNDIHVDKPIKLSKTLCDTKVLRTPLYSACQVLQNNLGFSFINNLVIFEKILSTYFVEMALDASLIICCRIPQLLVKLFQNFL